MLKTLFEALDNGVSGFQYWGLGAAILIFLLFISRDLFISSRESKTGRRKKRVAVIEEASDLSNDQLIGMGMRNRGLITQPEMKERVIGQIRNTKTGDTLALVLLSSLEYYRSDLIQLENLMTRNSITKAWMVMFQNDDGPAVKQLVAQGNLAGSQPNKIYAFAIEANV